MRRPWTALGRSATGEDKVTVKTVIIFKRDSVLCDILGSEIRFPSAPTFIIALETSRYLMFFFLSCRRFV